MTRECIYKQTDIGILPIDWKPIPLPKLLSFVVDNRGKTAPTSDKGIPLIATNCIKEYALYPIKERLRFISKETYDTWFRAHPEPNDIIFVNKGTPGQVCLVPDPVDFCIAQDMVALRCNPSEIDWKYLFAYLRSTSFKKQVEGLNVGTTIPHLKKTIFDQLKIPIPSRQEQEVIGDIYYQLSYKIELNLQMNQTLETVARTIFKEWFTGKDKVSLSEYIELNPRLTLKKDATVKYVEMADLPGNGFSIKSYIKRPFSSGSKFQNKDTLLARITPCLENGKTGFVDILDNDEIAFGSTEFIVMRAKAFISPYYVYLIAREYNFREFAIKSMVGTSGRQRVQTDLLNSFELTKVNESKMHDFHSIVCPLFDKIKINSEENKTLTQIRDSVLPKLITGKIEVKA